MYPVVRHEKRHPDGTLRRVGLGYLLPPHGRIARVYAPAGTTLWHAMGFWTTDASAISLFHSAWDFVPHLYEDPNDLRVYIDVARSITVADALITYEDLYLDIGISPLRGVTEKDEELLVRLDAATAAAVRRTRDDLRARISAGDALFDASNQVWQVPRPARSLGPLAVREP